MQIHQLNTENFTQHNFLSGGMPILLFAQITQKISKKFKTLDDIDGHAIVVFEQPIKSNITDKAIFCSKLDKDSSVAVIPYGKVLSLELNGQIRYFKANEIHMIADSNQNLSFPTIENLTPQEEKAYHWITSNGVGKSAQTICFYTYPKIKEYFETIRNQEHDSSHPYDTSDFVNCLKLIDILELNETQIQNLSHISPQWSKLIENLRNIQSFIEENNNKEAYNLIKQCIDDKPRTLKM